MTRGLLRVYPEMRRDIRDFPVPLGDLLRMTRLLSTHGLQLLRIFSLIGGTIRQFHGPLIR